MKVKVFGLLAGCAMVANCSDDTNPYLDRMVGEWQYVYAIDNVGNSDYSDGGDRAFFEVTAGSKVRYTSIGGVEHPFDKVRVSKSEITTYGESITGQKWENSRPYYFKNDTLVLRADGGFEYIDYHYVKKD